MAGVTDHAKRIRRARERVYAADAKAADARVALRHTIAQAREAGLTLQEIGNVLGVKRQRVQQLLQEDR